MFWFDKDGNVSKQSAFATSTYTYDALDRLLTKTYPTDTTLNASLTYDQATGHGSGVGHLTSLTDQAGSLSLSWDQRGLLTSNARTISTTTYTTGYAFQSAGRLASITYPTGGWKVSYGRDAAGQVTSVTDKPPSTAAVNLATSVTHLPFGPAAAFTYGNGVTDARTYDLDYRMTAVKDVGTGNIQYLSFGYNAGNNVTTITDNVTTANNQTLTYDEIDRMKSAAGSYGTIGSITYDSNSNRKAYGSTSYTIPSTSDKMSVAGGTSISYSSTGNVSAIGTTSFTWNKANQMATAVVSGTTSTYVYDAFGQRLKTTVAAGTPSVIQYDQANDILTETNSGTETDYAWLDGFPIAAIQPGASTVSAVHTNYLGTPQKATNASKTVVWTGNYDPNGKVSPTASITMNLRLPGMYADASGFYHNGFRNINPNFSTGRGGYLEAGPLGLADGLNSYPYAGSNSYKWTDRLGLQEEEDENLGENLEETQRLLDAAEAKSEIVNEPQASMYSPEAQRFLDLLQQQAKNMSPSGQQCLANNLADRIVLELLMPGGEPIGEEGNGRDIRIERGGETAAKALLDMLTPGAEMTTPESYRMKGGVGYALPNGGFIGYRPQSSDGFPTIDVKYPGVPYSRIHFLP